MATTARTGRPIWLELNAQRVTQAIRFYEDLFAWTSRPLHVPPWGAIPFIVNGDRRIGTQFMAMGAFAVPHWKVSFQADLKACEPRIRAAGGDTGQGIHSLGGMADVLDCRDPLGVQFQLMQFENDELPEDDRPGDPCMAEYWSPKALEVADFYATALGLERVDIPTGAMLTENGEPCLFLRQTEFEIQPPPLDPLFPQHQRRRRPRTRPPRRRHPSGL